MNPTDPHDEIMAIALGELEGLELEQALRRVGASHEGRAALARARSLVAGLQAASSAEPLFRVDDRRLDALSALAPQRRRSLAEWLDCAAEVLVAGLALDTRAHGAAIAGFRGPSGVRRVVFETEAGVALDLRITPSHGTLSVLGQIVGRDGATRLALGSLAGDERIEAPVDAAGFVEFQAAPGEYHAAVDFGGPALYVPRIDLRGEGP